MIGRALLAIGVLCSGAIGHAQSADVYLKLLDFYRDQPALAAQSVAKMSPQVIDRGIQQCRAGGCSLQQIRTAVMLHADAAEIVAGPDGRMARDQIRSGQELLEMAGNLFPDGRITPGEKRALATFGGRWYALTARLLLAHGHLEPARLLMSDGRVRYPDSPDLFVAMGLLIEWRAGLGLEAGDVRGRIVRGNATIDLQGAALNYRRALTIDPGHSGARLRLAWVHLLAADRRVWDDVPAAFIESANLEAKYLAHLLRGTAAEHEKNASSALTEYRAAQSLVPDSQTACVALSNALALNGRHGDARAIAAECLKPAAGLAVDAWTLFRLGLVDATTVQGMRDEARRQ